MRVLVIGGGAREHALAARFAAEPGVSAIVCAPGNPGIAAVARTVAADVANPTALLELAALERIDLTVVGPELPLSAGVVDVFDRAGRPILGPSAAAARLESSKAFAKTFMAGRSIPTAQFRVCDTFDSAIAVVRSRELGFPLVVKADGLAAGKGVVITQDQGEAEAAITAAIMDRRFGDAGARIVLEECLTGPEVSFFALCDGQRAVPLGAAQDHKRIFDDDRGPNTGGMGAFAPSPLVDETLSDRIMREIIRPVVAGMAEERCPFRGFLYAGLMLTASGPKVIEFNVRLGDPEAQVVLPLLAEPLLPVLTAAAAGNLSASAPAVADGRCVGVVLASRGYPETSSSGDQIFGIEAAESMTDVQVFHAGTALRHGDLVTAGGRVLTVVGRGRDFGDAVARAYAGVSCISFDGMQYRRDIGRRTLQER
jgi:phosphoribosylamine---glycine ligase